MSLAALDALDDALTASKDLLWPFDRAVWLRLAVVMFFVGGGGVGSNVSNVQNFGNTGGGPGGGAAPSIPSVSGDVLAVVAVVVLAVVLVVLALQAVGAVMEFVFVRSLQERTVRLRSYFTTHWRRGARLFAFRFGLNVLNLLVLAAILVPILWATAGLDPSAWTVPALLPVVAVAVIVFVLDGVVLGLVNGFTTMFVVPIMLVDDRTVIPAWKRLWGLLACEPKEFLVYLVVSVVLGFGVGIMTAILGLVAAIVVGIPFLIVGVVAFLALSVVGIGPVALLVVGAVYLVVVFVVGLVIAVPFRTYLRYYALLTLGGIEPSLDPVGDVRASITGD